MSKTDELVSKLEEVIKLQSYRISHYEAGNIKGHGEYSKRINQLYSEISSLKEQIKKEEPWTNDKVIDLVNWYLRLCKVITDKDCRFELENQNVIDSFLNGDDYKLWWDKLGFNKQAKKEENEQKNIRISRVFYFVVMHKTDCYNAFKLSIDHEGYKRPEGKKLIELARKEIGYSDKTWSGDIYSSLYNTYKSIVVDGVNEPEQIIKDLSGEKIEDVKTVTSIEYILDNGIERTEMSIDYDPVVDKAMDLASKKCGKKVRFNEQTPDLDCGIYEEKQINTCRVCGHQNEEICNTCTAFQYDKQVPVKEITDEDIDNEAWVKSGLNEWSIEERLRWAEGVKWMRNKMKS